MNENKTNLELQFLQGDPLGKSITWGFGQTEKDKCVSGVVIKIQKEKNRLIKPFVSISIVCPHKEVRKNKLFKIKKDNKNCLDKNISSQEVCVFNEEIRPGLWNKIEVDWTFYKKVLFLEFPVHNPLYGLASIEVRPEGLIYRANNVPKFYIYDIDGTGLTLRDKPYLVKIARKSNVDKTK